MSDKKFCVNCAHCRVDGDFFATEGKKFECHAPEVLGTDLITGEKSPPIAMKPD
jgi:hypothetical protein